MLTVIQSQITLIVNAEKLIAKINAMPTANTNTNKLESTLKNVNRNSKLIDISDSLYGDFKSELISKDEYFRHKANYSGKIENSVQQPKTP